MRYSVEYRFKGETKQFNIEVKNASSPTDAQLQVTKFLKQPISINKTVEVPAGAIYYKFSNPISL